MPALAQMHGHARVLLHVVLEQLAVFGMLFVEQHPIVLTHQPARHFRRARIVAQLPVRVHPIEHPQVIVGERRTVAGFPEPGDAL
jgi:hypothetical protein